jgi:hypothetical protein
LLLVFRLPASRASQRVEIWRKLQRFGAMPLRSSGYVLPNNEANQENFEWLAAAIRNYRGDASVVEVRTFDDLPDKQLAQQFHAARSRDYKIIERELKKLLALSSERRPAGKLARLRRRIQEIAAIDFFSSPGRARVETLLARADETASKGARGEKTSEYRNRIWLTRPRPGIDRVSSAWLIRRFIDPRARFAFADDSARHPEAVPFDMFGDRGFGHRGEDCTFETLCKHFSVRDGRVKRIAQMIHDADLEDEKFGRVEALGLHRVLKGWARQDVPDDELLERGMEVIEGLYHGLP